MKKITSKNAREFLIDSIFYTTHTQNKSEYALALKAVQRAYKAIKDDIAIRYANCNDLRLSNITKKHCANSYSISNYFNEQLLNYLERNENTLKFTAFEELYENNFTTYLLNTIAAYLQDTCLQEIRIDSYRIYVQRVKTH